MTESIERNKQREAERERELNELREKVRKAEQADLSELERTKSDLETKTKESNGLAEVNRRLAIENAFLLQNSVKWHDPAAALKLVDLSSVEVKDGAVTNPDALKEAIKKLADSSPWMVAAEEDPGKKKPPAKPSGQPPNGKQPDPNQPDFDALAAKYPALRHHRPISV